MKNLICLCLLICTAISSLPAQQTLAGASAEGQKLYKALIAEDEASVKKIQTLRSKLEEYRKQKNKSLVKQTEEKIAQAESDRSEKLYKKIIRENKDSALSVYAMGIYAAINLENPLEVEHLLNGMSPNIQNTEQFIELRKFIEISKKLMVGQPAPVFSQADTSGSQLSLASFKGKYVLIDFWASWCKPCRAQNPALVRIYEKFKHGNFTIIGVSLDSRKENWTKAIRDDKLSWYHVSDLQLWSNAVARLYNINSVPQTYLVDPNGIIVAKNLREEKLEETLQQYLAQEDYPEMKKVEGGTFIMGDIEGIGQDNERPLHEVTLADFSLAKTETTVRQWKTFCRATGRQLADSLLDIKYDDYPIASIKWEEAIAYTDWLSKVTGKPYRLPTEAEWEYAAKGGKLTNTTIFAGSANIEAVAWYGGNSGRQTHPVAQKQPNELGLYDMTGNVWEWCQDRYQEYTAEPTHNPRGAAAGDKIVFRGGGWYEPDRYCRTAMRAYTDDRNYTYQDLGFRVASN